MTGSGRGWSALADRRVPRIAIAALAAAFALGVAACGSSDTTDTSAATGSGAATAASTSAPDAPPAVKAAQDLVAQYSKPQPPIEVPVLPSAPPKGKSVAILTCAFPSCKVSTDAAAAAAKALGWTSKTFNSEISPEAYVSTWNDMLQTKPDLIVNTGLLPNALIKAQLAKVAKDGIPAVNIATWDPPGPVIRATYIGAPELGKSGELMGAAVVADAGGPAKAVFVWDPNAALMAPTKEGFEKQVTGAGGSVDVLKISNMDVGKAVPGQVASYLQAHPDVKYVAFAISDFSAGVPQALKGAGLDGVKIISRSPHPTNLEDIKAGTEWAAVAEEDSAAGYRAVDALARILQDAPFEKAPEGWHQILTKDNVTDTSTAPATPGSPEAFLKAWGVSQ